MNENEELWPDGLLEDLPITPVQILQEIASGLGPKTRNIVFAEAQVNHHRSLELVLRVPTMNDYQYGLFHLALPEDLTQFYPMEVVITTGGNSRSLLVDEQSFRDFIAEELTSPETKRIIRSLLAQAKYAAPVPA